jgi:hypothetical protein
VPPMNSPSEIAVNMPNASLMYQTFTATFGNLNFQIAPSMTGQVNLSNGTMPYLSLEALIYAQQVQSATNPVNTTGGQTTGQNNVQGSITAKDGTGNLRVAISGGGPGSTGITGNF